MLRVVRMVECIPVCNLEHVNLRTEYLSKLQAEGQTEKNDILHVPVSPHGGTWDLG